MIRLAILGTKYLMTGPVYPQALEKFGISYEVPDEADREQVDRIIFQELVNGLFLEPSRRYFNEVMQKLRHRGCEAAVLGCTEIPLIVDPSDCPFQRWTLPGYSREPPLGRPVDRLPPLQGRRP